MYHVYERYYIVWQKCYFKVEEGIIAFINIKWATLCSGMIM